MEIVRTAVIGVGGRGRYFARMYDQAAHPGFELRAVCDLQPDRLELVRSARGEGISYHSDMHELFARDDIDAVLVVTQDPDHAAQDDRGSVRRQTRAGRKAAVPIHRRQQPNHTRGTSVQYSLVGKKVTFGVREFDVHEAVAIEYVR